METEGVGKWQVSNLKVWKGGPQIWIPEIEYYQKVSSHAQIGPHGAEQ